MSVQAKLFITLCKQTVSWTGCRWGRGVAREVREGCQQSYSLTPITLPLSLLLCFVLITPQTHAPSPGDCTRSWRAPHVFISEFPTNFPLSASLGALLPAKALSAESCLRVCERCVETTGVCGGCLLASGLWEAGWWASLTHSTTQAA